MSTVTAYPLCWPAMRERTPYSRRSPARFHGTREIEYLGGSRHKRPRPLTVAEGRTRIMSELQKFGADSCVISSNLVLNLDGTPRSGQPEPADPGVAIYFQMHKTDHVMACDRWERAADNMAAIAAHIDAIRRQLRYGVIDARDAFRGFASLPSPAMFDDWRQAMGYEPDELPTPDELEARYVRLRSIHHPDKGGSAAQFHRIQKAYERAKESLA